MSGRHTANIIWALAKLGERDEALLGGLCSHLPRKLGACSAQNIANMFWAFGDLGARLLLLLRARAGAGCACRGMRWPPPPAVAPRCT
jgi:hypothetical protein